MTTVPLIPTEIAALQTDVLRLALLAAPGSELRRKLVNVVASCAGPLQRFKDKSYTDTGELTRDRVVSALAAINRVLKTSDEARVDLRGMRDNLEDVLDRFDLPPEVA